MSAAFKYNNSQIETHINIALEYNFISETATPGTYKFTHDRLLRNIYFDISEDKRENYHWTIAKIELNLHKPKLNTISFIEACQHAIKSQNIIQKSDRLPVSIFLIEGGKQAKNNSDFKTALLFFSTAKNIIEKTKKKKTYTQKSI